MYHKPIVIIKCKNAIFTKIAEDKLPRRNLMRNIYNVYEKTPKLFFMDTKVKANKWKDLMSYQDSIS